MIVHMYVDLDVLVAYLYLHWPLYIHIAVLVSIDFGGLRQKGPGGPTSIWGPPGSFRQGCHCSLLYIADRRIEGGSHLCVIAMN